MSILLDPDSRPPPALPDREVQADLRLRTVLYVEDNPANLLLVERLIARRSDLKLLSAATGRIGIQLARDHKPDLILLDINMPGSSGFEVLESLRKDPGTLGIPVIALSSNAHPRDIEKGLEAGFFRYITKPYKIEALFSAIDAAMI